MSWSVLLFCSSTLPQILDAFLKGQRGERWWALKGEGMDQSLKITVTVLSITACAALWQPHVGEIVSWSSYTPRSPNDAVLYGYFICLKCREMRRLPFTRVAVTGDGITWRTTLRHMTMNLSSLISIGCAARSSLRSISRPTLSIAPTPSKLAIIRTMSDANKARSEEEWRAVLSPEQVCP